MCLLDFAVTLNDYSHDSVDPRLLNFHHHSGLSDPAVFSVEKVQHAVVVDWPGRMNVDIIAQMIWIFQIFWSDHSGGPADGDEEPTAVKSSSDIASSDAGVTIG